MKERLRRYSADAVDLYRIAPLGSSIAMINIGFTVNFALRGAWIEAISNAGGVLLASGLVYLQTSLSRRLERSIEQHGYQERVFETTVHEWCDRQTARVVAERHGVLPLYQKLCFRRRETISLPFIPHF